MRLVKLTNLYLTNEPGAIVLMTLLATPKNGRAVTHKELQATVPLMDKLADWHDTKSNKPLELTDPEWQLLVERVTDERGVFGRNGPDVLALVNSILQAQLKNPEVPADLETWCEEIELKDTAG